MAEKIDRIKLAYEDPNTEQIIEQSILYDHEPVIEINEDPKVKIEDEEAALMNVGINGIAQKGVFKCFECIFSCPTTLELAVHYQIHRLKNPFKCFYCGYEGQNKETFLEHSISHVENNFYKCSKCKYKTSTVKAMKAHISLKHDKFNGMSSFDHENVTSDNKEQFDLQCRKLEQTFSSMNVDAPEPDIEVANYSKGTSSIRNSKSSSKHEKSNLKKEKSSMKNAKSAKMVLKTFTCPTCFFIFPSEKSLHQHDYNTHIKNWKVKRATKHSLQNVAKKQKIQCEIGTYKIPFVNVERLFLCPFCYIIFLSEYDFNDHNSSHNIVTDCHLCGNKFLTNYELQDHIKDEHPGCPTFSCINCGKFFATDLELQSHLKSMHNTKGVLTCPFCPRLIKTEQGLKLHIEAHGKVKTLKCQHCNYIAINPSDLKKHSTKHAEPKYICPNNCGAAYKTLESLTNHIRNCSEDDDADDEDDQDEDFEMKGDEEMNSDSFEDVSRIEIDISQKDKLICSECKTSFEEPSQLKEHLLVHFNSNPFRCQKCGHRCSTKLILEEHMRNHSDGSSIVCSVCNRHFESSFKLNRHMFSHSLGRPFECSQCSLTFETKDSLQNHMQRHGSIISDEKSFTCRICDYSSETIAALKNHMITNHIDKESLG